MNLVLDVLLNLPSLLEPWRSFNFGTENHDPFPLTSSSCSLCWVSTSPAFYPSIISNSSANDDWHWIRRFSLSEPAITEISICGRVLGLNRRLDISRPHFGVSIIGIWVFLNVVFYWVVWLVSCYSGFWLRVTKKGEGMKKHLTQTIDFTHDENSNFIYPNPFIIITLPFNNSFSIKFEYDVKVNIAESFFCSIWIRKLNA